MSCQPEMKAFYEQNGYLASAANRTDTWRRALILHYATADARSEHARLNEEISLRID